MKKLLLFLSISISILLVSSCEKEAETKKTGITYPDSIYHGQSILSLPDSAVLVKSQSYGFAAELEKDASLSIKMTDVSVVDSLGYRAAWYYAMPPTGWLANQWDKGTQQFIATQTGKIDLQMMFQPDSSNMTGICRLDFYENSTSVTKTKYLRW